MARSPFDNPEIQKRIVADVSRIQSAWLEWNDAERTTGDYDTRMVKTLVKVLDVHARAYLNAVDGDSRVPEYRYRLRRDGSALMENAENRGLLSDPYSEDRLRKMAENTGHIIIRRHELAPEKYEAEIRAEVERCRSALMPEALKWHEWKNQLLIRIETRFEARYRHWDAEAIERAQVADGKSTTGRNIDGLSVHTKTGRPRGTPVNGERLRALRGEMSQERFAAKCGVSVDTIQSGENGGCWSKGMRINVAKRLAIPPEDLNRPC
jgi:DNA-binding transcriptional regulator YiaG